MPSRQKVITLGGASETRNLLPYPANHLPRSRRQKQAVAMPAALQGAVSLLVVEDRVSLSQPELKEYARGCGGVHSCKSVKFQLQNACSRATVAHSRVSRLGCRLREVYRLSKRR